jgi:hypothetical protein
MILLKKYIGISTLFCVTILVSYSSDLNHQAVVHSSVNGNMIKSISEQIESRLLGLGGIEFRSNINVEYTELGLRESGEEKGHSFSLHFAASPQGNYLIDVVFKKPESYKGVGMKSVYDGKRLLRLIKGGMPILVINIGDGKEGENIVMSGFNPILEGLSFIQPDQDSEVHPNNRIDWSVIVSKDTISKRMSEVIPSSIKLTSDDITFQIPGEGILDGRSFNYEVVIALPMGLPIRMSRLSLEDKKPISVYEVVDWKKVKDKEVWIPAKVKEEIYNKDGELLVCISGEITECIIHREFSAEFFNIPLSEADFLRDEDNGVTIDLRSNK